MIRLMIFKDVKCTIPRKRIQELFDKVINEESDSDRSGRINLIFTSDNQIKKLNKTYRKKDKATDVLSFNIDRQSHSESVLGEIYISYATARKQAAEFGSKLNEEVLRLVCHGLLHLFGYDHIKATDRKVMELRERFYLRKIALN